VVEESAGKKKRGVWREGVSGNLPPWEGPLAGISREFKKPA